jgi:hypothetical protein
MAESCAYSRLQNRCHLLHTPWFLKTSVVQETLIVDLANYPLPAFGSPETDVV